MLKMLQTFIRDLQESSHNRKSRWLFGCTLVIGFIVVSLWSAYFPLVLRGDQPDLYVQQNNQIIEQNDFSIWRSAKEGVALFGDNISNIWNQLGKRWTVETVIAPN